MNDRLPQTLRTRTHVDATSRCVAPPLVRPIPADALRAAYGAHMESEHGGRRGLGCRTCRRYLEALVTTRAAERTQQT